MEIIGQSALCKKKGKKIIKHTIIGKYMAGQHIAETEAKMNIS